MLSAHPGGTKGGKTTRNRGGISVVVPAYNAEATIADCLQAIRDSTCPGAEIVVVNDASLDDTGTIARRIADVVVDRPCRGGAARARNDGAQTAKGHILVFVDADVIVNPPAVSGLLCGLDGGADAVFGAYQPLPLFAANGATMFKNLLHHYTHLYSAGEVSTFWSGFGATRRDAFVAVHGFDPAVTTGADVEDIHLGYRMRRAGFRIVLDPSLQIAHQKRYTVRSVVASDFFHRAIPWTRAMFELRTFRADLN